MAGSFTGTNQTLETIILSNPLLAIQRWNAHASGHHYHGAEELESLIVPEGHEAGGMSPDYYEGYRKGLDSACADIVITTFLPDGTPAVLASKRDPGKPFGNKWWMQGGAIHSYRGILHFLTERAEKESGVHPFVDGFIGVFRTCARDMLGSTINLCYVGHTHYMNFGRVRDDQDHTTYRLLTLNDVNALPENEQHWYPMYAFRRALTTMPPSTYNKRPL